MYSGSGATKRLRSRAVWDSLPNTFTMLEIVDVEQQLQLYAVVADALTCLQVAAAVSPAGYAGDRARYAPQAAVCQTLNPNQNHQP
jgi:hypothetical protein